MRCTNPTIPPCACHFLLNEFTLNKVSNKNDMVCAWRNFQKLSCGIATYDKFNFKPQISSIFHFDRVSDSQLALILGVKTSKEKLYNSNDLALLSCSLYWKTSKYDINHNTLTFSNKKDS